MDDDDSPPKKCPDPGEVRSRLTAYRNQKQKFIQMRKHEEKTTTDPLSQQDSLHQPDTIKPSSWWILGLKLLLWVLVWGFFIEVEFGLVYLVTSGLVFIVVSLRGGRKRVLGELSAYSVFNENFETIEGTLSPEQFERELRYGPSSVR